MAEVPRLGEDRQTGREKKGGCQDGSVWRKKIMWAKRKDSNNGVKRPRGRIQASTIGLWKDYGWKMRMTTVDGTGWGLGEGW